jgi:type II secretory pathway pseudopilin PulG
LSLLEVLVALAIFLFSIVALHQALNVGTNQAIDTQQRIQASQLAQSKMAEVYVGAVPLSSQSDTPFDEDPDYTWSVDAEPFTVANLWNVTVTVKRTRGDGGVLQTQLCELIIDPSIRGTNFDSAYTATLMPPSSTGGGASGAGGAGAGGAGGMGGKGGAAKGGAAKGGKAGGGAAKGGAAKGGGAAGRGAGGGRGGGGGQGGQGVAVVRVVAAGVAKEEVQ